MRRSLRRTFSALKRPTLTSRSLQSITRPFQKRFREVFGNAQILIFYLSIKAWEEKSLPKSHLGWFFLVFDEGKAAKENISIFWFIWPLKEKKPGLKFILRLGLIGLWTTGPRNMNALLETKRKDFNLTFRVFGASSEVINCSILSSRKEGP